jgi:Raf kinase inhibitor-like YbhB/YbcL family protein
MAGRRSVRRRTVFAGAVLLLAGCTGDDSADDDSSEGNGSANGNETENPARGEVTKMGGLSLSSSAFDDGEQIPDRYGYTAENVNPPLRVAGVPDGAASLALVMDDPDAVEPAGKVWDHWVVWNIPATRTEIPEDWTPGEAVEGTNDYGEVGYGGPNPPDREHRYRFKLFALDTTLDVPAETDADAPGDAMAGHVLAQTQLDGTYPV